MGVEQADKRKNINLKSIAMTKEEFITRRTEIISEMLDNPDEHGIYPTTECFKQFDALFDELTKQADKRDELIEALLKYISLLELHTRRYDLDNPKHKQLRQKIAELNKEK